MELCLQILRSIKTTWRSQEEWRNNNNNCLRYFFLGLSRTYRNWLLSRESYSTVENLSCFWSPSKNVIWLGRSVFLIKTVFLLSHTNHVDLWFSACREGGYLRTFSPSKWHTFVSFAGGLQAFGLVGFTLEKVLSRVSIFPAALDSSLSLDQNTLVDQLCGVPTVLSLNLDRPGTDSAWWWILQHTLARVYNLYSEEFAGEGMS